MTFFNHFWMVIKSCKSLLKVIIIFITHSILLLLVIKSFKDFFKNATNYYLPYHLQPLRKA